MAPMKFQALNLTICLDGDCCPKIVETSLYKLAADTNNEIKS